jgi:hypothetical protein
VWLCAWTGRGWCVLVRLLLAMFGWSNMARDDSKKKSDVPAAGLLQAKKASAKKSAALPTGDVAAHSQLGKLFGWRTTAGNGSGSGGGGGGGSRPPRSGKRALEVGVSCVFRMVVVLAPNASLLLSNLLWTFQG